MRHVTQARSVVALVAVTLAAPLAAPRPAKGATVGVITAGGTPVVDIASTGLFSAAEITVLYPQGATPTLVDALGEPLFDAVLVYSNGAFDDPEGLGDVLADFVDAGGGAVLATFCFATSAQYRIGGRIVGEVGYSPFVPQDELGTAPGTFAWPPTTACHPLFDGIDEAPTYLWYSTFGKPALNCPDGGCDAQQPESVVLAWTDGGDALAASNAAGTVMAINIHASANTVYNQAATRLFANALWIVAHGGVADCNGNATPDNCDIEQGTSADCQSNGLPDECEIAAGTADDCNGDTVPDACEIATGTADDCNANGLLDVCEIDQSSPAPGGPFYCTSECTPDCNDNGVPDGCEPTEPGTCDCNSNGVADGNDIAGSTSDDCNGNGQPDECEIAITGLEEIYYRTISGLVIPDATTVEDTIAVTEAGAIADVEVEVDITHSWVRDLTMTLQHGDVAVLLVAARGGGGQNFTGTLFDDEADQSIAEGSAPFAGAYRPEESLEAFDGADQAGDWTLVITDAMAPDDGVLNEWTLYLEIEAQGTLDCNGNGVLDECDIAGATSSDVNGNEVPDDCEEDCNYNGVPDGVDLAEGTSPDCNGNGRPDECDRRDDPSLDCNDNLVLDECDIAEGTSLDLNGDGLPDECERPCTCGDLSGDGLVELDDFATFAVCYLATATYLPPNCTPNSYLCADFDGDGTVSLPDFATFSAIFRLPPDNANCNW